MSPGGRPSTVPPRLAATRVTSAVPLLVSRPVLEAMLMNFLFFMSMNLFLLLPIHVQQMGGAGPAVAMAEMMRHNAAYEPKRMLDHMGRIHNIHGKFYQMDADYVEPSIPYDKIVATLKQGGYDGYICSEYEGNRWIEDAEEPDSVEQVRRQQEMLKRLIGEPTPAALAA